jgi:hypothetical protein
MMNESIDHILTQVGLQTPDVRGRTFAHLGISDVEDLTVFYDQDVDTFSKSLAGLPAAQRVTLTALQKIKLKAVCDLCRDLKTRGNPLDQANVLAITAESIIAHLRDAKGEELSSAAISAPAKFEANRWITWHLKFLNFLKFTFGVTKIPLYYVVREKELTAAQIAQLSTASEQRIYQAPLHGTNFNKDNRALWGILKDKVLDTAAWPWISAYSTSENGRGAMLALRQHYNGIDQTEGRISYAQSLIAHATFSDAKATNWEAFVTQLKSGYEILDENDVPTDERMKVRTLLEKIVVNNPSLIAVKQNVSMAADLRNNFNAAVSAIGERVVTLFPDTVGTHRKRVVGKVKRGGKSNPHHNRQPATSTSTSSIVIPKSKNGVDLSNPLRFFTKDEITKIGDDVWKSILTLKKSVRSKRTGRTVQMVTFSNVEPTTAPAAPAGPDNSLALLPAPTITQTGIPPTFGNSAASSGRRN